MIHGIVTSLRIVEGFQLKLLIQITTEMLKGQFRMLQIRVIIECERDWVNSCRHRDTGFNLPSVLLVLFILKTLFVQNKNGEQAQIDMGMGTST